jgi:ATP-dependent DNA helicase RecQ
MQQYAEARICRRRVLLAYFGEDLGKDCGNCDVCKNPPRYVDGTVIAQKALSAIYRLKEAVPLSVVIDVLRASGKKEILEKGYDKIKTYGAGMNIPYGDWQQYLLQMLNAGLLEIAYDEGNALKLTASSKEVLFNKRPVQLYKPQTAKAKAEEQAASRPRSKRMQLIEELFERLKALRLNLASRAGIPPHLVFSDATLQEMAGERPTTEHTMHDISGVGDAKFRQYGHIFIEEIIAFMLEERANGANVKGSTQLLTFEMLRQGESLAEIVRKRGVSYTTIYTHLVYLYEQHYPIDLNRFISQEEIILIEHAIHQTGSDDLTDLHELLDGQIQYDKIRLGVAIWNHKQGQMNKR